MKSTTIQNLIFSLLLTLFLIAGVIIGRHLFPLTTEKETLVSDRKDRCEAAGGKYGLYWNDYSEEYNERCEVVEDEITNY